MIVAPRAPERARTAPAPSSGTTPAADAVKDPLTLLDQRVDALEAAAAKAPAGDDPALEAALDAIRERFDLSLQLQAELQREQNALRDLALQQIKRDDEIMKKWIEMI